MANKVANVDDVTEAITGVAVADRAPRSAHRLTALQAMPSNLLRSHLHRLPAVAPAVAEPMVTGGAGTSAVFAAMGRTSVGAGVITAMAANAFDGRLFVANHIDGSLSVLDGYTLAEVSRIAGTPEPYALAVTRGRAYVGTVGVACDAITVTDAESVVAAHALADSVSDVVADRDGRRVYVARTGRAGADVAVIDTATASVRTIDVASRIGEVANIVSISGDGRTLFLATTDHLDGRLVVIDAAQLRVIDTLTVAEPIRGLAASHDGATVWVAIDRGDAGAVVDAVDIRSHRVRGSVAIPAVVRQLMLSAVGDRVYATTDENVAVLCADTFEVVDSVDTGSGPSCVAESADGSRLYIADYNGQVSVFSVASATPSMLDRMSTPEALAGPAVREFERV